MKIKTILPTILAICGFTLASRADAAVIVTLPTATVDGSIVITNDINFTITTSSPLRAIILDNWVSNDGSYDGIPSSSLSYSINGGPPQSVLVEFFGDNFPFNYGSITTNDGIIGFASPLLSVSASDLFTIKAATYTLRAGNYPSFNPQANQTFTGNAFLLSESVNAITGLTSVGAVPEPSSALLLLGGFGALVLRRRR